MFFPFAGSQQCNAKGGKSGLVRRTLPLTPLKLRYVPDCRFLGVGKITFGPDPGWWSPKFSFCQFFCNPWQ